MKKIFIFNGSPRGKNSVTQQITDMIIKKVEEKLNERIEIVKYSAENTEIMYCKGCQKCFYSGKCFQDEKDSMKLLKEEMLNSDMIVLATPIYAAGVTAYMKNFIDRISSWLHLMRLAGKKAIFVTSSTGNGVAMTNAFLYAVACSLGLQVIEKINALIYKPDRIEEAFVNNEIEEWAERIKNGLIEEYCYDEQLEKVYTVMKQVMMNNKGVNDYEYLFWLNNSMFNFSNFEGFIKSKGEAEVSHGC